MSLEVNSDRSDVWGPMTRVLLAAGKETLFGQRGTEGVSKPLGQKTFRFPCFGVECRDIRQAETEAKMSQPAFDPFGEPVPAAEPSLAPDRASKWLKQAGTGLFWVLVVAIVLARAVYFEPGSFSFDRAVAWVQGLFSNLQG